MLSEFLHCNVTPLLARQTRQRATMRRWLTLPMLVTACCLLVQASDLRAQDAAQLQLAKTVDVTQVESGVPFAYTLAYKCASVDYDSNCAAPVITDVLPPEVVYRPDSATTTSHVASVAYREATHTLQYVFHDPLPAGSTGILHFEVYFPPGTLPGTLATNDATFSAANALPVTTPSVTVEATGQFEMDLGKSGGPAVLGAPVDFSLALCSPDDTGGVRFLDPMLVDTLPDGARFIDAEGTAGVDWIYTPATAPDLGGTVQFISLPDADVGACLTRQVTLQYDTPPAVPPVNTATASGVPQGCADPDALPAHCLGQSTHMLTATHPFDVVAPYPVLAVGKRSQSPSSFAGNEAVPGEAVTYFLEASNTGYVPLQPVTVVDELPAQMELISFTAGGTLTNPVLVSYQVNDASTWQAVTGGPFAEDTAVTVASLGLAGGDTVTDLRWQLGAVAAGSETWQATLTTRVRPDVVPVTPAARVQNCAVATTASLASPVQGCTTVSIVAARAIPLLRKQGAGSSFLPLDKVNFTVELANSEQAQLPLSDPLLVDFLPPGFAYVAGSASFAAGDSAAGAPAPLFEAIDDYAGSGRTLLRWAWQGTASFDLPPGAHLVVNYQAEIAAGTPPGEYVNTAALADWRAPADPDDVERDRNTILLCSGENGYVDLSDLDGDGNRAEESCQDTAVTTVGVALAMNSEKLVRGQVDCATYGTPACEEGDYNKLGLTVPGGPVDYRLQITNTSNVSVTRLVIIDLFPRPGDSGVVDPASRLSQWRPALQGAVAGPGNIPLTIFYSEQENSCRPELGVNPPGCVDAGWTTTVPADTARVRAIKLDFCRYAGGQPTTDCLVLPRGAWLTFDWLMAAPGDAPAHADCGTPADGANFDVYGTPACQIAWNSFGYTAAEARESDSLPGNDPGAQQLLPAEPNKVGIRIMPAQGELYAIGDLLWRDVAGAAQDGQQQPVEQTAWGVDGVRVELYDGAGRYLGYRLTAPNQAGNAGYYRFADLPAGDYKVRFYLPAGYQATAPAVPPAASDSDGVVSGIDATFGPYFETTVFALDGSSVDADRADLTRDFGLWQPVDFGDAYQTGSAPYLYPTQASLLADPAAAARHLIVPGLYLGAGVDAETDGQPHASAWGDDLAAVPDDEDGVAFAAYLGTPAQPIAQVVPGAVTAVTVTATAPEQFPAYLNGWIDWNGDGDWDEAGEQVVDDRVTAGTAHIDVAVPVGASPGTTFARFRYSTQPGLAPTGTAADGEVEDYAVHVLLRDWGDLPDTSYPTRAAQGGATHLLLAQGNPYLGAGVDAEGDGQPHAGALGDDTAGSDDEDGIEFLTPLMPGTTAKVRVQAGTAGYLSTWIDFDGDGTLDPVTIAPGSPTGVAGSLVGDLDVTAGAHELWIQVPAASAGTQGARFRFTRQAGEGGNADRGPALSGEVEDYLLLALGNQLWFDNGDAAHPDHAYNGIYDPGELPVPAGVRLALLAAGTDDVLATTTTDAAGRYLFVGLPPGVYQVRIEAINFQPGGPLEGYTSTYTSEPQASDGGDDNDNGSDGDLPTVGVLASAVTLGGDVAPHADLTIDFGFVNLDWGDAPASYGTAHAGDGPRHVVVPGLRLGAFEDAEADGQPTGDATGDDRAGAPDDEDGVTFVTPLIPGRLATLEVEVAAAGYLNAWIDFDGNGLFDLTEQIAADMPMAAGSNRLEVAVPAAATGGMVNRFRFTGRPGLADRPTGWAGDGEVEDYILASLGDLAWFDTDRNGLQGADEGGTSDVVVTLCDGSGAPLLDGSGRPITATTDSGGGYRFAGLPPATYRVHFGTPDGYRLTLTDQVTGGGSDADDSDADAATGLSAAVTLAAGQHNPDVDAGFYRPVVAVGDYVWFDHNGDGRQGSPDAEPGVPGVVVTLYDAATDQPVRIGDEPRTAETDDNGRYRFDKLPSGTYYVHFDLATLPPGNGVTASHVGDAGGDSDIDPVRGQSDASGFLAGDQENLTLDMGIAAPDLRLVKRAGQASAQAGEQVFYTLAYVNAGLGVARNVAIEEVVPAGTRYVAAASTAGWECPDGAPAGTRCRLGLGTLAPAQAGSVLFALRIDGVLPLGQTTIENTALIVSETGEVGQTLPDNRDEATVAISLPTALEPVDEVLGASRVYLPVLGR